MTCILSCENDIIPINTEDFSVQQIITNQDDDYSQVDSFSYDANGKLVSVTTVHRSDPDFIGNQELIEFQYNGDVLINKTHRYLSTDTIHRQVSFTYLSNGALHQALHAYPYTGIMEVQWIDTYAYNTDGSLKKKTSVNPNSTDTESSNQYYWKNGNVNKIESYYNGQLRYESFYKYDRSINFKKGNPFFSNYEISLATNNNIIEIEYKDYSGLLDLACNPCSYSYEYNDYNLPTQTMGPLPFGQVQSISYEITEGNIN